MTRPIHGGPLTAEEIAAFAADQMRARGDESYCPECCRQPCDCDQQFEDGRDRERDRHFEVTDGE